MRRSSQALDRNIHTKSNSTKRKRRLRRKEITKHLEITSMSHSITLKLPRKLLEKLREQSTDPETYIIDILIHKLCNPNEEIEARLELARKIHARS